MHPLDPNAPTPMFGMLIGYVTDRVDPKKLGRVRARIPGYIDEGTAWALPLGLGGGANANGTKFVPPVGAQVALFFANGDIDSPYYLGANAALGANNTGDDNDPDVRTIETDGYVISIDERPDTKSLTIQDKTSGSAIQLNGKDRSMSLTALSQIDIKCDGFIRINGLNVFINDQECGLGKI